MCERLPADCLPPRRPHAGPAPWPLDRRRLLAGLGCLALTACAPARRVRRERAVAPPEPRAPVLEVVRRAAWGAQALRANHDPMERVTRVTLHHTAEVEGTGTRSDAELVRGIQHFHQDVRGWADIGYHWVVGRDGRLYEGRALDVQGAHAGGGNNVGNLGISLIGDYRRELPGPRQLATTRRFLEATLRHYGLPTAELRGHRDFKPTECPGDALYAWLQRFKAAREARAAPAQALNPAAAGPAPGRGAPARRA